jgi:hypothetical protein
VSVIELGDDDVTVGCAEPGASSATPAAATQQEARSMKAQLLLTPAAARPKPPFSAAEQRDVAAAALACSTESCETVLLPLRPLTLGASRVTSSDHTKALDCATAAVSSARRSSEALMSAVPPAAAAHSFESTAQKGEEESVELSLVLPPATGGGPGDAAVTSSPSVLTASSMRKTLQRSKRVWSGLDELVTTAEDDQQLPLAPASPLSPAACSVGLRLSSSPSNSSGTDSPVIAAAALYSVFSKVSPLRQTVAPMQPPPVVPPLHLPHWMGATTLESKPALLCTPATGKDTSPLDSLDARIAVLTPAFESAPSLSSCSPQLLHQARGGPPLQHAQPNDAALQHDAPKHRASTPGGHAEAAGAVRGLRRMRMQQGWKASGQRRPGLTDPSVMVGADSVRGGAQRGRT